MLASLNQIRSALNKEKAARIEAKAAKSEAMAARNEVKEAKRRVQNLKRKLQEQQDLNRDLRAQLEAIPSWVMTAAIETNRFTKRPIVSRAARAIRHPGRAARRAWAALWPQGQV